MKEQKQEIFECEGCGTPMPDKDLTNVMAGVPLDIYVVCPECLEKLENGEL